jgi:protein-tyrosine phosphatase
MLEARAEYLAEGFAAVEQEYGDVDTYLREGLYLDEATLAAIRTVLLEPADQLD